MKLRRRLFLCLVCLSLFSSCAPINKNQPHPATDKKQLIARINDSVFCISIIVKTRSGEQKYSVGTGFLVHENTIASVAHVQAKAVELSGKLGAPTPAVVAWKRFAGGEVAQFPLQLVASDEQSDLAIYHFDPKVWQESPNLTAIKPLVLAEHLPLVGTEVVSVGYYGAYEFPFNSIGNVAMIDVNGDVFSDLTLMPGNSGAPVCSLETGEVVGVTTEVLDLGNETVRFGIARRAAKLRELLQKL